MNRKFRSSIAGAAAAATAISLMGVAVAGAAVTQGSGAKGDIDLVTPTATIAHGGSSFSFPFVSFLTTGSGAHRYVNPKVTFGTDSANGSGDGRSKVASGAYDIGYSDQPMNVAAGTAPSGLTQAQVDATYAQAPLALGGVVVGYNLPGHNGLQLSAKTVAGIYNGSVNFWDDKSIKTDNPKVKNLPHTAVTVEFRSKSSGTTFAFTDWLHSATAGLTPAVSGAVMEGTGAAWHATNTNGVANNAGMASAINGKVGAIGYVEYSYLLTPGNKIQAALLQGNNGKFVAPSLATIAAAATAAKKSLSANNFSIVDLPGTNVWPLATFTWAIVKKNQTNAANGEAAVKFLDYATHGGQLAATANGYVPLSAAAQLYARTQLLTVKSGGAVLLTKKN